MLLAAVVMLASSCTKSAETGGACPGPCISSAIPFEMPKIEGVKIAGGEVVVTATGAKGDGKTKCTEAIQKAIDTQSEKGGGRVVVPQGVWLTGPIVMKSGIDLHLEAGAVLLFSADIDDYPKIETVYEGTKMEKRQSPITGEGLSNIAITGRGVIDGNGQAWRPLKKQKVTESQWKRMTKGGEFPREDMWYPSEERVYRRPVMVHLESCKNVLLQGVTFQNSPAWNIHPMLCENVVIDGITARNPAYAQNGDALDLESCKNVYVLNSVFDAGDDCICLKSGRDEEGRKRGVPTENVVVSGCTVFSGHGGFVVGSEMSGGVRNVYVENCQFVGTDAGLRFKSCRGRGGVVENIYIKGVSMAGILGDAVTFDMHYGAKSVIEEINGVRVNKTEPEKADETTPVFRNIDISDVSCVGARRALYFNGLPEMPIKNIKLRNISIKAENEGDFFFCEGIDKENVEISVAE